MLEEILSAVPAFEGFPTLDEFNAAMDRLAAMHPDAARLETIGVSTEGEPIRLLRVGHGRDQLLFIGCPHPNEPIGLLSIEVLAHRLLEERRLRGERFTWNFVLCADPDGLRLNEGWIRGPFTLSHYARAFYRPSFEDQAILTFPFVHREYSFLCPTAETQALVTAITALRPCFVASLHNAALGGGYFYLSPYVDRLGEPLRGILRARGIPLSLGAPEVSWAIEHSPAVFECATVRSQYDALAAMREANPAGSLQTGETTYGFARGICDPLFLIGEVPYFADPRIGDTRSAGSSLRESILAGIGDVDAILSLLTEALEEMSGLWATDNRLRRAVERIVPGALESTSAQKRWAADARGLDRQATVAEDVSHRVQTPFYHVLNVGMLRRALRIECGARPSGVSVAVLGEVEKHLEAWLSGFEHEAGVRVIPIRDLVEVQLAAALLAIETL